MRIQIRRLPFQDFVVWHPRPLTVDEDFDDPVVQARRGRPAIPTIATCVAGERLTERFVPMVEPVVTPAVSSFGLVRNGMRRDELGCGQQ
jgi:hypothetical protein